MTPASPALPATAPVPILHEDFDRHDDWDRFLVTSFGGAIGVSPSRRVSLAEERTFLALTSPDEGRAGL